MELFWSEECSFTESEERLWNWLDCKRPEYKSSYLKEPWALVIYHDRFIDLKKELREILVSVQEENQPSVQELVWQVVYGELALLERPKTYLKRFYKQTIYRNLLEKRILSYLSYNNYHLPMFAWPGIV